VLQIFITADDEVISFIPATHHQPLQLPGSWKFNIVERNIGRSENNLARPFASSRFDFYCREILGTMMHQWQYLENVLNYHTGPGILIGSAGNKLSTYLL
jgi:hypothetical protein